MKRKMYFILFTVLTIAIITIAFSCKAKEKADSDQKIIVAMATDVGGLGDKSFNDGSYAGLQKAANDFGIGTQIVESKQQSDYIPNLDGLAESNAKIVFAVGFLMSDAVVQAANNNPEVYFGGVDIFVDPATAPKNFKGLLYKEHEAGYLAGVIAGLLTYKHYKSLPNLNDKNVVGMVLGMDIPPVERYQAGFFAGVKSVNPDCKVISVFTNSFNDQAKGKEAAISIYNQGADIVFQIAGLTGLGVFQAAKEKNAYAFGVDVDQNYVAPEVIITSAFKNITETVYLTIQDVVKKSFVGGQNMVYGLKENGVGIAPFHNFEDLIPQEIKDAVKSAIDNIINGKIVVPASRSEAGYK